MGAAETGSGGAASGRPWALEPKRYAP